MTGFDKFFVREYLSFLGSKYAIDRKFFFDRLTLLYCLIAMTTNDSGLLFYYTIALAAARRDLEQNPGGTCA